VLIEHRQLGRLVETRHCHNTWTALGKSYLSQLVSLQIVDSTTVIYPQVDYRLRYLGLGIGGNKAWPPAANPQLFAAYPPGYDPNSTVGTVYDCTNPTSPPISSLERPVRVTGGTTPYATAPNTDVWLFGPPNFSTSFQDISSITFTVVVDCTAGEVVYSPFTTVTISEAALFNSSAASSMAYNVAMAYVNFSPLQINSLSVVTLAWTVRFTSDAS